MNRRFPLRSLEQRIDDRRRARIARCPLAEVDLPEQLDHPAFDALPQAEQDYRRRRAVAVLARRQRRSRRSVAVGAVIFAVTLVTSLAAEQQLRDGQSRERDQRIAAVNREAQRRTAAQARFDARARYIDCVHTGALLDRIRDGIIKAQPPISTAGATGATLARIETQNAQRARTRAFFRQLIPPAHCGRAP